MRANWVRSVRFDYPAAGQDLARAAARNSPRAESAHVIVSWSFSTVAASLASIYNGSDSLPVRLDEIRGLDWTLQRDLITVIVGTGYGGFEDFHIREAFLAVGGEAAVEWFHWYTSGGPHRAALTRLSEAICGDGDLSTYQAQALRDLLRSVVNGKTKADLACLNWMSRELAQDFVLVLDGVIGRNRGHLSPEEISAALTADERAS